jgi:FlaA1/EpsC-like NDP-sugar epimerase
MSRVFTPYLLPRTLLLALIESALIALSLFASFKLPFLNDSAVSGRSQSSGFAPQALAVVAVFQICFCCVGLYDLRPPRTRKDLLWRIGVALGPGCLMLWLACFLSPNLVLDRGVVAIVIVLTAASVFAVRLGLDAVWRLPVSSRRVLIVGAGDLARAVERELRRRGGSRTEVMGFVAGGRETQSVMQSGGKPL